MGGLRKFLAIAVALGLAPGTWVRSEVPPKDYKAPVTLTKLATEGQKAGPLTLEGAWLLESRNDHFGGYSALVDTGDGAFLAASDAGRLMVLPRPDRSRAAPQLAGLLDYEMVDKKGVDIESLARDPASGTIWAGLEWSHAILRFSGRLELEAEAAPAAMAQWGDNAGAESLVRLADGRFLAIEERAFEHGLHQALLFAGDPTTGAEPERFVLRTRKHYRPSDAALLPDGRIALLLRKIDWGLPPTFPVLIAIADPARIEPGEELSVRILARIDDPLPSDNYEGLAVTVEDGGDWALWLISDDNFSRYQRTILLKLRWPQQRARR